MRSVGAVVALVACLHVGLWTVLDRQQPSPNIDAPLASVSYTPYSRSQNPDSGDRPTAQQIRADLKLLSPYTRAVRTYSSTGGVELVPGIAAEFGMKVTVGIWLTRDKYRDGRENPSAKDRNEREIASAIALARRYSNVNAIVVGNEGVLRGDFAAGKDPKDLLPDERSVDDLIRIIQRVKRQVSVPVTTGETRDVWEGIANSDKGEDAKKKAEDVARLAASVDFIAAHILPFWDEEPANRAVDQTITRYEQLRRIYPGKHIVIAEFGWPSAGYNFHAADPGRIEQAEVIRDFVARAEAYGIDYNIVEAFDQPWKTNEGGVGTYWGLFDAWRQPKFAWAGPISDPDHWKIGVIAVLVGLLLSLTILAKPRATAGEAFALAIATNAAGAWFANVFAFWNGHYFVWGAAFALGLGILLLIPLVLIALGRIEEIAAVAFGEPPRRLIAAPAAAEGFAPKISIHIPAHREPPEMLKQTLDALARLEYPNFECVLVINNTPDPACWQPVEEHCRALGQRFKFVREERVVGYKAGALRLALAHTAPDAEVIGIIDADYVVRPDWLKDLVGVFIDPRVAMVQAPQDHRDGDRSLLHHAMNSEYAGFFDIGMVQRNEANAIIIHGTMCLIRRAALEAAGGWSSDTIVEDTDLGLGMLEQGWKIHYTNRRYGHGLLPDTFEAYKKQRHRWAYGGFQIIRKHWSHLLPGSHSLAREQKREFGLGWLNWLGAESIGVAVALLNLLWVPVVAFVGIAIPDTILTLPILAAFAVSLLHFLVLYRLRVKLPLVAMMGSVVAAMSVQWTVARAVGFGIWKEKLPFMRTAKGGATRKGTDFPAFWEGVIAALLIAGALTTVATNYKQIREVDIFAFVLVVQSLPFLAAVALAAMDGSRFNQFAYWGALEAKVAELLPRRAAAQAQAKLPSENRIEAAQ